MGSRRGKNLTKYFADSKAAAAQLYDLAMTATAQSSKAVKSGPGGADGNHHIANQSAYLKTIAFARMMEHNDPAVYSVVNRLVNLVNVGQMTPEPNTGSDAMNEHLQGLWQEYASDPEKCDSTGRWNYETQADVAFRRTMVDGDILPLPSSEDASFSHLEGHRCQTPTRGKIDRGVCGVETRSNRPYRYHLVKKNPSYGQLVRVSDVQPVAAYSDDGWPNVLHCYHPKMFTLFRGVSALGACGTISSRRDDLEFATILKAQVASCVTFIESVDDVEMYKLLQSSGVVEGENADIGEVHFETNAAGFDMATADIHPGMVLRPKTGKKLTMQSPNIPGDGQLELNMLLLQYLAMCWDIPLAALLLDAKGANFSTWRGVMDLARDAAGKHQRWWASCYHRPRYRHWIKWLADGGQEKEVRAFLAAERKGNQSLKLRESKVLHHTWNASAWKYYEPTKDATGDLIQLANGMQSYDQFCRRRWGIPGTVMRERIISFNAETYRQVLEAKQKLQQQFPKAVVNEHLLFPWAAMSGVQMHIDGGAIGGAVGGGEGGTESGAVE